MKPALSKVVKAFFSLIVLLFIPIFLAISIRGLVPFPQTASISTSVPVETAIPPTRSAEEEKPHIVPTPISPPSPQPFYQRITEMGEIIESGYSRYSSHYYFVNQWLSKIPDKNIMIFAGAVRTDLSKGGKEFEKPWPGVIVVEAIDKDGNLNHNDSGELIISNTSGPVRIIDERNGEIILSSEEGEFYTFDIEAKTFRTIDDPVYNQEKVSSGILWESKNVPIPSGLYKFVNYWGTETSNPQIYIFAGAKKQDPSQGIFVKYIKDPKNNISEGSVYSVPIQDGEVRIVDALDNKVILATTSGIVYAFDITTNELFNWSGGKFVPFSESGWSSVETYSTESPIEIKETPLPTPTITPLPTLETKPTLGSEPSPYP